MEPREILLKRLDETTVNDLRKLNAVLFPVKYAVMSVVLCCVIKPNNRARVNLSFRRRLLARALFPTNSLSFFLSQGIVLPGLRGGGNVHVVGVRVFF